MPTWLFIIIVMATFLAAAATIIAAIVALRMKYIHSHWGIDNVGSALAGVMPDLPSGYHWSIRPHHLERPTDALLELRVFKLDGFADPEKVDYYNFYLREDRGHGRWREPSELNRLILQKADAIAEELRATAGLGERAEKLAKLYVR